MSYRITIAILGLVLASEISWTQDGCGDQTAQGTLARYNLRNLARHRSPIRIDGYVTFQDDPAGNVRSYWVHASARNTSKKGIAAWSASLETTGRGSPELQLGEVHDFFFTGDVLAPNETEGVTDQSCPTLLALRAPNSNRFAETADAAPPPTNASVRIQFVQFTDGSIWGDRDEATKLQLERRETLDKVKSLQQVYSERGDKAFMDALAEPTALPCFERIKTLCRNENTDSTCARKQIAEMLTIVARQRKLEASVN